jgi:6-pyruvoyl-tetrahydropterin synthase
MKPTLENIDKWFFDSLEGNLSTDQQELLAQFIAQHPELELEQEAWAQSSFEAKPITFEIGRAHV